MMKGKGMKGGRKETGSREGRDEELGAKGLRNLGRTKGRKKAKIMKE